MDSSKWAETEQKFEKRFLEKTQSEWAEIYENSQACCNPVLSPDEAHVNSHNLGRGDQ